MAELRYLTIPKSADVYADGAPWSFVRCAIYIIDRHPIFSAGEGMRAAKRVCELLEGKKEADVVVLDKADWQLVNQAFEAPVVLPGETPDLAMMPFLTATDKRTGQAQKLFVPPRTWVPYLDAVSDEATKKIPDTHAMTNGVPLPLPPPAAA